MLHQGNQELRFSLRKKLDFPVHLQNAVELVWVKAGTATAIYGSRRIALEAGDFFAVFPNQSHGFENDRNISAYVMIVPINPYLAPYRTTFEQMRPTDPVLKSGAWADTQLPLLMETAWKEWDSLSIQEKQGYTLIIIGKLLSLLNLENTQTGSPDALQAILLYINSRYTEPIARREIAQAVGYNESYISHMFSLMNTTFTDYITSMRLQDAKNLLRTTHTPISQIALSLGFGSIRSFNRVFFQCVGRTPSQYRKLSAAKTDALPFPR